MAGRGSGGSTRTHEGGGAPYDLIASVNANLPLDAVILFKNTGAQLSLWARETVPSDVVTVMASTLLASAEVLLEHFGDARPSSFVLETERRSILFHRVDAQVTLALVAPKSMPASQLRAEASRLARAVRNAEASPASTAPEGIRVRRSRSP